MVFVKHLKKLIIFVKHLKNDNTFKNKTSFIGICKNCSAKKLQILPNPIKHTYWIVLIFLFLINNFFLHTPEQQ